MEKIRNYFGGDQPDNQEGAPEDENYEIYFNDMLGAELISENELWIHVDDVRNLGLSEKMRHLRDGFGKLAEALKTDPKLQGVQKVSGMSWIVSKNPKLLKSLGFEVAEDMKGLEHQLDEYEARKEDQVVHQDDAPGYAYRSTEKFISLYGHDSHEAAA